MFIDDDSRSLLFDLCSFRFERSMKIMAIISIIIYATAIFCRFSYGHPNYNKVNRNIHSSSFLPFLSCIGFCDPIDYKMHTFFETKKIYRHACSMFWCHYYSLVHSFFHSLVVMCNVHTELYDFFFS